jgi:hypothetical protein
MRHAQMLFCLLAFLAVFAPLLAQPDNHHHLIFSHPLTSGQSLQGEILLNNDGLFDAERGWQATQTTSQLQILFDTPLPLEGTLAIRVTNFDPAQQWVDDLKLHIINLYSRLYSNNKDIFETDGAWCNIRTGSGYSNGAGMAGFKVLAATRGIGTREEFTCLEDYVWRVGRIFEFRIAWTPTRLYVALDGNWVVDLDFSGQIEPFKYLLLGRDNLIWGYCAQPGPYYFDLRIYEPGEAAADTTAPAAPRNINILPLAGAR